MQINLHFQSMLRFFRSHDYIRAVVMSTLMIVTSVTLYVLGYENYILGTCIGILLTSFNDLQGSFTYRAKTMIISILVNGFIVLIINLLQISLPLVLIFIGCICFALYMLSVFGNRASMVAFSGALCIVLSLVEIYESLALIFYVLSVIAGGFLYAFVSSVYHLITRSRQTDEQLGELAKLTADYILQRIELTKQSNFTKDINLKLLDLQVSIIEKQEKLGALLLSDKRIKNPTGKRNHQMLTLIQLIDFMELAVANPSNLAQIKKLPEVNQDTFLPFLQLAECVANRLTKIANELHSATNHTIEITSPNFNNAESAIQNYLDIVGLPEARKGVLLMHNLVGYYNAQLKILTSLEELINHTNPEKKLALSPTQQLKFLKKETYSLIQIKENLKITSPVFRHALRIATAMLLGYFVGELLKVERPYWIMLTVLMILRSNYGLTIQRSKMRVGGTILGAIITLLLIQLSNSFIFFVVLASVSMTFAFSLIERNYTIASLAITLNVIFAFALLDSQLYNIILYRVIDTIIGALVALFVAIFILPNWEFQTFKQNFSMVLKTNQAYWREIRSFYASNKQDDTNYRLKRKATFMATSHLNASFQRYKQDPKSKRVNEEMFDELVTLNQSLLSRFTNLGNYLKLHHIPKLNQTLNNIWQSVDAEFDSILNKKHQVSDICNSLTALNDYWKTLEDKRNQEFEEGKTVIDDSFKQELQEVQMLQQELHSVYELMHSIKKETQHLL